MSLIINLRLVETENLELKGTLPVADLDVEGVDELIKVDSPLAYDLEVQKMDNGYLVTGSIKLTLKCECARCLTPFKYQLDFPDWACLLETEGEEKVEIKNDRIDLTPFIREDILLSFPQQPLCDAECGGLPTVKAGKPKKTKSTEQSGKDASAAWTELNKLKF